MIKIIAKCVIFRRFLKRYNTVKRALNYICEKVVPQIVHWSSLRAQSHPYQTHSHTLTDKKHRGYSHTNIHIYVSHTHLPVSTPENSALFLLSSFSSLLPLLSRSPAPSGDDSLDCRAAPLSTTGSVFVSCSFEVLI